MGFDALAMASFAAVHINTQPAKLLFHLQHFKLTAACLLEFGDQRFQVLAEPPEYVEPAIVIREAARHRCVRMSPLVLNQRGQRSTRRCSSSLCI